MDTIKINAEELTRENWSSTEASNVKLVTDFVQLLMNDHDFDEVLNRFNNPYYQQHNRSIPDGMEALIQYVRDFTKRYPDYAYDVKHIHADGDMVIFHSQITTSKKDRGNDHKGFNVSDTWRVVNGQIVEHWDTLQPMSGFLRFIFWIIGGRIANNNGIY